jgi:carboxylesterase type B
VVVKSLITLSQEGPVEGDEDCLFINVYTPKTNFEQKGFEWETIRKKEERV